MDETLYVGTRKGLFTLRREGEHWSAVSSTPEFRGEPVSMVLQDPRDDVLYVALNLGHFGVKLWRRTPGDTEWTACAAPAFPAVGNDDAGSGEGGEGGGVADSDAPSVEQIWCLEASGADAPGELWAGTIPGGLFRSHDRGDTWTLVDTLWNLPERSEWMGGGYDHPGIHSICIDPRTSAHVTIGVSTGGVWTTRDSGATWRLAAAGMEADYMPPERRLDPNVQDVHRLVQCAGAPDAFWAQHHNGIFRTVDGGNHWRRIQAQPSSFGFAVAVHPDDPDLAWFVPAVKDECRMPVDGRLIVNRTRDGGETFTALTDGLPAEPAFDLIYRHGLSIDSGGRRLAMGSTTGGLWTSPDGGDHWHCVSAHFPPIYVVRFA
ncbi:glycosyl hydrolase [Pandoraea terrae]|uniref:Glycosyl hydrolase n=1 Tax=Pandoraea terrae TaxID=1537710 RepID=A0A5E4YMZ1_9BURK|nr:exo-alpha-sialidase [Pandoraea terrae]VVE49698.1 glycosyl hydrolase [Pandoraea terrae]